MFESAELGHTVDKSTYKADVPGVREALLNAQLDLAEEARHPVILVLSGADGSGKREVVHTLTEWMDPRHIQTHAMREPSEEERERPEMWRFWRVLPPRGKIGVFFHSWYSTPVLKRVLGKTTDADLDQSLDDIARFEKMLVAEGAILLKIRLHISKKRQKERLQELESDPKTRWRVTKDEWKLFKHFDEFTTYTKRAIRRTDTPDTPWIIVDAADERYRNLTVAKALLDALRASSRTDTAERPITAASPFVNAPADRQLLRTLDGAQSFPKASYDKQLEKYQGRLALLTRHRKFKKRSVIAVFEGWDAAGKGGCIRRVIGGLDPRQYHIVPTAAPTDEERAQPYLWRFWRNIPGHGLVTIFDRSWYGRVLVERVEGFCSEADWRRAYGEINDFEEQLIRNGSVVVKFWLNISKDEQLRRFKEREQTGFKRFKITEEDWHNRNHWEAYERAVCDTVDRTSTEIAPWTLIEANDKSFARIKVLETLCAGIRKAL
jgi:AMP-polyphosphate phosphotransferase